MHKYLLFLAISFSFFHLNAQSLHTLDVWGTSMWPDTSTLGATVHFDLILENTDSASAYNDIIDLYFFVDSTILKFTMLLSLIVQKISTVKFVILINRINHR